MNTFLASASAARWDIYGPIHKGLRLGHVELLLKLGQAAFEDGQPDLLAQLRAHLQLGADHLAHEEQFIHPALEARVAGACATLETEHDRHRERFSRLEASIAAVERAAAADRPALGRALYLDFSAFVAEDLEHMRHEEVETWPLLCANFTDEELAGIEMQIIASLTPDQNIAVMRLMLPAMNHAERTGLLTGMKAGAPAEAYAAVIDLAARPTLPGADFAELKRLGLAA